MEKRVVNVLAAAHERDRFGSGDQVTLDIAEQTGQHGDQQQHAGQQPPVVIRDITRPDDDATTNSQGRKKFLGIF